MPRVAWILGPAILVIALHPRAQTPSTQPVFRGGTDLVQVDVSVLDNKRRPVRGLTAADFTILEDGQPREIQAFTEVHLPDRVRTDAAPWVRDVPRDVVSNQAGEDQGRLVTILLDRTIPVGEPTVVAQAHRDRDSEPARTGRSRGGRVDEQSRDPEPDVGSRAPAARHQRPGPEHRL